MGTSTGKPLFRSFRGRLERRSQEEFTRPRDEAETPRGIVRHPWFATCHPTRGIGGGWTGGRSAVAVTLGWYKCEQRGPARGKGAWDLCTVTRVFAFEIASVKSLLTCSQINADSLISSSL